jgi:SAM-dependent methyltransferase
VGVVTNFPPQAFGREDESNDAFFYSEPRFVAHIDDFAIAAVGEAYRRFLPAGGAILDLMSSWISHFPADFETGRVVGLGMNAEELAANPRLADWVAHDLNLDPVLPFADEAFDGAVVCVSVQYLTRPVDVFRDVGRTLRPGAPFIVAYSNRCFPTKAVRIWQALDDADKGRLVATYLTDAGTFEDINIYDFSSRHTLYGVPADDPDLRDAVASGRFYTDPLYVVVGKKKAAGASA